GAAARSRLPRSAARAARCSVRSQRPTPISARQTKSTPPTSARRVHFCAAPPPARPELFMQRPLAPRNDNSSALRLQPRFVAIGEIRNAYREMFYPSFFPSPLVGEGGEVASASEQRAG